MKPPASQRISQTSTFRVEAPLEKAFPLFGPILEKEWAWGWDPKVVYSSSALIEEKMIFRTKGREGDYTWIVSRYEPQQYLVEYTVYTQERVWFITVLCSGEGQATEVSVTYTYTGLTETGNALNRQALDEMFKHDLKDWEEAIAWYLVKGKILEPEQASLT